MAAMAPERGGGSSTSNGSGGRTLHNFNLPPRLSWGTQRLLRCSNSTDDGATASAPPLKRPRNTPAQTAPVHRGGDGENRIDVIREKLLCDFRSEVDKMRANIFGGGERRAPPSPPPPPRSTVTTGEVRPWNLRTRRAAFGYDQKTTSSSPVRYESVPVLAVERDECVAAMTAITTAATAAPPPRAKFSVSLSKHEIEDDFIAMLGRRPPRKPKKRPRAVQKQLDAIFPGSWLTEINADMYKVDETPEPPK